jgi:hypothetical protein
MATYVNVGLEISESNQRTGKGQNERLTQDPNTSGPRTRGLATRGCHAERGAS